MKRILLLALLFNSFATSFAQDFSNKGKDFWLGYGYHVRFVTDGNVCGVPNCQQMVLYFATENIPGHLTNIKIEIPALGYVQNITNVAPGTIAESAPIPKTGTQDARLTTEGLSNKGIHVTSNRPVVAYTHIYENSVSGATLLFPFNTLGKEYYSINYKQVSNEDQSNSFFFVVAADTGVTNVEITPSAQTLSHAANVPFTVSLNQGQIYNVMGKLTGGSNGNYTGVDLTGSKIRSVSNGSVGCKRIAVFSGAGKMKISCNTSNSSDNLMAQAFPKTAWGKIFLTAPTKNMPYNYFRVAVSDPASVVKVNGVVLTGLVNNFYYDLPITNQPKLIESDQPIMVAQFITTANSCSNTAISSSGDPEMIYLSPVEQTIDEVVLNSTSHNSINEHWVNVVIKTNAVSSFSITGANGSYSFLPHPQNPVYSYAQIKVLAGSHTLKADSGFNAIAYGYGNAESYGYNAGTNLKDLYNFVVPLNPLNISGTNSACACTPFYYTVTYPFQPTSLYWDFKGFQIPNVTVNSPVPDTTYFINGKQVWRYKLPTPYSYCPAGNYPLAITAGTPGTDGCGNTQIKDDTLFVRNTPTPAYSWTHNGCVTDSVRFTDNTVYETGVYSYKWTWDFGDGSPISTLHNPVHKYASTGTYTVKFSLVTNIGCISTVLSKTIVVTEVPLAKFGVIPPLCLGKPITFTDSSTVVAPGTISKWYWDFGDGKKDSSNISTSMVHTYNLTGSQTVTLNIQTPSGCASLPFSKTFIVNPNPVVDFTSPAVVCLPYDLAQFNDISTIADNTQASFNWLWHFGEPSSGANDSSYLQNPTHLYSSTGPFSVRLDVKSAAGCTGTAIKPFSKVYAKATAGFTVNAENCLNTATGFASSSNGQGNTITNYYWDFGDGSATGSGQNTTHTYTFADTFTIKHWVRTDKGCNSDTITKTVIINPLPVASFSFSTLACEKNNITITNSSTTAAGNITQWIWNFGNGRPDSVISNGSAFLFRYDTTGTFNIKLSLLTDKGCRTSAPLIKTITVNPLPKPGFISPEVCLTDASAKFSDTSSIASGSIVNWSWNFGDPRPGVINTANIQNPQHLYNAIGLYTTVLTVTSDKGCVDSLHQSFTVNGDRPKANFIVPSSTLCAYDSAVIKDSSTVDFGSVTKVEIFWDMVNNPNTFEVDDLPDSAKIYKHLYAEFQSPLTKVFVVKYKSYSGASCVDSVTKAITVHAVPKTQFTSMPNQCLDGAPYQITEASEIGGVPGSAVFSGPGVSSNGLFTPSLVGAGTYRILYTYTSAFGCMDTVSQSIRVLNPAIANFGFTKPFCEKNPVNFTDSSSIPAGNGTITNWSWNFGDGTALVNNATAAPVTHTYAAYNTYTVMLTLTTSNGCKVSRQKTILINPLPAPFFTSPASICFPDATATFTDASTIADNTENTFTYFWNFGDPASGANNTSVSKNPTHTFGSTSVYNVTLTCTSGAGCRNSTTIPFNSIHPQPTADFTSDSVSICENQSVKFSDNSNGADGVVSKWNWDFGNNQTSTDKYPVSQTYVTAKVYRIELQIENNFGCKDTIQKNFTVYAYPSVNAGPDRFLLEGGELTIDATATGNGLQYLWIPSRPSNFLNNIHILKPLLAGLDDDITYTLAVVATGGCRRTDEVFIKLLKAPVVPNTFTPNGDQYNPTWVIKYIESYPDCSVKVFNRDGQPVFESYGYKTPWDGTYQGKKLPFGTYYYVIEPGSGRKPITGYVTIIY